MGQTISDWFNSFFSKKQARILILGLDNSGKTSILYKLKNDGTYTTIPTIGFNVETVEFNLITMVIWDIGGRDRIRSLYKHYYRDTNAVVFVIDSLDKDRIQEVKEEIHKMNEDELLKDVPFLIFANKQDLPNCMNVTEIFEKLNLYDLKVRKWHLQQCSAINGDGLIEGFNWVCKSY